MPDSFVAYYRVSTGKQEHGIDAQKRDVRNHVSARGGTIGAEFEERETGKRSDRPQMLAAIAECKARRAILIFAKLDRLSRDAAFIFNLKAELDRAGVPLVCTALPELNTLTLGIFATMAQHERETISARTKAGLQEARAKGKRIGRRKGCKASPSSIAASRACTREARIARDAEIAGMVQALRMDGKPCHYIATMLNLAGKKSARGGNFSTSQVYRIIARIKGT